MIVCELCGGNVVSSVGSSWYCEKCQKYVHGVEKERCPAIMVFGDDFGDNSTTFHCQGEKGHTGKHVEQDVMYDKFPYKLEWDNDMVEEVK